MYSLMSIYIHSLFFQNLLILLSQLEFILIAAIRTQSIHFFFQIVVILVIFIFNFYSFNILLY